MTFIGILHRSPYVEESSGVPYADLKRFGPPSFPEDEAHKMTPWSPGRHPVYYFGSD